MKDEGLIFDGSSHLCTYIIHRKCALCFNELCSIDKERPVRSTVMNGEGISASRRRRRARRRTN
jgi:hypothetical protein